MPRSPKTFVIQVSLAPDQTFSYTDLFTKLDASTLAVINGDQIAWVLDASIPERTLQIDFGAINPFHIFRTVTLRGNGQVIAPSVQFPATYTGNRQLKYTVSLGNGLHDDPEVVPVPNNGGAIHTIQIATDFRIEWTDDSDEAILLNPDEVTKSAEGTQASVTWSWNVGANDPTPPFDLTFTSPPPGWPTSSIHSTDVDPVITLSLPPGPTTKFTITTLTGDGSKKISANGYLTIT